MPSIRGLRGRRTGDRTGVFQRDGSADAPASSQPHVGATAREIAEHASALTRLEIELAVLEVKRKVTALGLGAGMAVGAAILTVFAVVFLFAAIAAAIAIELPVWAALLIVTGGLLAVAAALAAVGIAALRRGTPPVPKQAIEEARLTTTAIKS